MGPERLYVPHQVVSGVVLKAGFRVTGMRSAAACPPLIEQHYPVARRVEEPSMRRNAAAPRPSVHHQSRLALWVATNLPIDAVAVADIQEPGVMGLDLWEEPCHQTLPLAVLLFKLLAFLGRAMQLGPNEIERRSTEHRREVSLAPSYFFPS